MNKIGIINLWPELPNAEKEYIARLERSANLLEIELVQLDQYGRYLDTKENLKYGDLDFVIHIHFLTPKVYDAFSYVCLWNPPQFYYDWGYEIYSGNLATHDDFLSAGSEWAEDHVKRRTFNDKRRLPPKLRFHPTLSGPILPPTLTADKKLFYCGVNWERLSKKQGRHNEVLKLLDKENVIQIYGPYILMGVQVWKGYKNYVKSIPFDGISSIEEINKCGIALVFSSEVHNICGIMSNRLYEASAAGAVIISDENPFVKEHFGDSVLYVNTNQPEENIANEIIAHCNWANKNPDEAQKLAEKSQKIFVNNFLQKDELLNLIDKHTQRKSELEAAFLATKSHYKVNYICLIDNICKEKINLIKESICCQRYKNILLHLIFDTTEYKKHSHEIEVLLSSMKDGLDVKIYQFDFIKNGNIFVNFGKILENIILDINKEELICLSYGDCHLFSDHFSSAVRIFEDTPSLNATISDIIFQCNDEKNESIRYLREIRKPTDFTEIARVPFLSSILFKAGALKPELSCIYRYLTEQLSFFIIKSTSPDSVQPTNRATTVQIICEKTNDTAKTVLPSSYQQLLAIYDVYSPGTNEMSSFELVEKLKSSDIAIKQSLTVDLLRNIPMKLKYKNFLLKIYKSLFWPGR